MYIYICVDHYKIIIYYFRNLTLESLAIPDTFCSPDRGSGYQCPAGMECMALELTRKQRGFDGFDMFGIVYLLIILAKIFYLNLHVYSQSITFAFI